MSLASNLMGSPVVDGEYLMQIEQARKDLHELITTKECAPILLRLAWHDACTYDSKTKTGGPNGSIRNDKELKHNANKGLETAIKLCEQVKTKNPKITYADLYQLAGVVAVEVTGGPIIEFVPGRKDSLESPEEGQLPDAKKGVEHLKNIFYRMGLTDRDIVALSGAHTLGRAHLDRLDFDSIWTKEPNKFDNSYFVELLKEETHGLLKLPTDKAILEDPSFRAYVELYAQNQAAFFRDYAISHKKLSELGFIPYSIDLEVEAKKKTVSHSDHKVDAKKKTVSDSDHKVDAKNNAFLTQSIAIVAVATALVVFGYFFEIHRKVK